MAVGLSPRARASQPVERPNPGAGLVAAFQPTDRGQVDVGPVGSRIAHGRQASHHPAQAVGACAPAADRGNALIRNLRARKCPRLRVACLRRLEGYISVPERSAEASPMCRRPDAANAWAQRCAGVPPEANIKVRDAWNLSIWQPGIYYRPYVTTCGPAGSGCRTCQPSAGSWMAQPLWLIPLRPEWFGRRTAELLNLRLPHAAIERNPLIDPARYSP
jgi:hypothetical protein